MKYVFNTEWVSLSYGSLQAGLIGIKFNVGINRNVTLMLLILLFI